jgi:SAM-dependent methyltransferase
MQPDPKQGEREYFARIGAAGILHSTRKPFSDEFCSANLSNMDALFHFLAPPPARLIEFGCGVGWLSLFLATRGYQTTSIDISPDAIAAAREQAQRRGIANAEFLVGDYEDPVPRTDFDYALFYDSLHHAEVEQLAVQRAYEALKSGGAMIAFETHPGHSETEASKHAVKEFGVHEKDMSVDYIAQLGARFPSSPDRAAAASTHSQPLPAELRKRHEHVRREGEAFPQQAARHPPALQSGRGKVHHPVEIAGRWARCRVTVSHAQTRWI